MNDSVRFAKWLKQKIDYNHVTIYQISKESGIHQSTIKNWLNGAKPQTEKMDSVIQAIKRIEKSKAAITLAELDGDELPVLPEQGAKKAPDADGEGKDALDIELRKIWDSSDLDDRKAILEYAHFIKGRKTK